MSRLFIVPCGTKGQVPHLPDKEFRYLRTVRVTAGVYPGFGARALPGENPANPSP